MDYVGNRVRVAKCWTFFSWIPVARHIRSHSRGESDEIRTHPRKGSRREENIRNMEHYAHVSSPAVVPLFEHCSCAHLCLLNNMQSNMSSSCIHIALVDCNNFFVSCERLFRPDLAKKPVIVLSSNDGCVISRSNEARVLGFKMGEPYFSVKETCVTQGVAVFSSNFPLYRDISRRVMHTLARFSEHVETYSIDEAFLEPPVTSCEPLEQWACSVRRALLTKEVEPTVM